MSSMIVYKITNNINNKVYIGQTTHSIEWRWKRHLRAFNEGANTHLYQAMRKYGVENFEIVEICRTQDKTELNRLETYYIGVYDSIKHGYNMVDGGDNNVMDLDYVKEKHNRIMRSPEVRKKISDTMKRKIANGEFFTEEHRRKLSEKAKERERLLEHKPHTIRRSKTNKLMLKRGDTRSVNCFCIDYDGNRYDFHSILDAGKWWYDTYKPFPYSSCVYQRKIKQSIDLGYATYGRNHQMFEYPKWFKGGDADVEKVTSS